MDQIKHPQKAKKLANKSLKRSGGWARNQKLKVAGRHPVSSARRGCRRDERAVHDFEHSSYAGGSAPVEDWSCSLRRWSTKRINLKCMAGLDDQGRRGVCRVPRQLQGDQGESPCLRALADGLHDGGRRKEHEAVELRPGSRVGGLGSAARDASRY